MTRRLANPGSATVIANRANASRGGATAGHYSGDSPLRRSARHHLARGDGALLEEPRRCRRPPPRLRPRGGATTADAEWLKHNLGRAVDSLPNGFCGRPPQQDCPHPNACLTCADFQTTVQFLPVHRHQADATRGLIEAAEGASRERLAANHRRVLTNLEKIIPALEALEKETTDG